MNINHTIFQVYKWRKGNFMNIQNFKHYNFPQLNKTENNFSLIEISLVKLIPSTPN